MDHHYVALPRSRRLVALVATVLLAVSFTAGTAWAEEPPADEQADAAGEAPEGEAPSDEPAAAEETEPGEDGNEEEAAPPAEEPGAPRPSSNDDPADAQLPAPLPDEDQAASTSAASSGAEEGGVDDQLLGAAADDPPVGALAAYVASRTRLSWNGNDYGIYAFIPTTFEPTLVESDGAAVGGVSGTQDFHAVLADVPGIGRVTYMVETAHLDPYSQDCTGAQAWFDAIPDFSATCENFKADYFTNNGAGADYTWTSLGGFENGPDPTVMAGDTSPATLVYDPDAEPPEGGGGDEGDGGDFPGSDYVASFSPFAIDGTAYDDPVPGLGSSPQTVWFVSAGDVGPTAVTADGTPIGGLFDDAGVSIGVFLADIDSALSTMFLDDGFGVSDCDGFETFIANISGGQATADCHAAKTGAFTFGGAETDYTFAGFDGFVDGTGNPLGGTVTVADGHTAPPTLAYQVTPPGGGDGGGQYLASRSPLSWNGNDYGNVHVLSPDSEGGTSVTQDDTPIPNVDGTGNYHVALSDINGQNFTYVIHEMFLPTADCAGFDAFLAGVGATGSCDNFKADYLTGNGVGEDYTFTGLSGFENAGTVVVTTGGTDPPYLRYDAGGDGGGYVASNSPLSYGGVDYDDPQFGGTQPGVFYLAADDTHDPVFVEADDTPIPAIGADGNPRDVDAGLIQVDGGAHVTIYADSGLVEFMGGTRDCDGLVAAMAALGAPPVTCANYKQGVLTAPVGGSSLGAATGDYGFTGLDGFDAGGPVTVVDGFTDPPYLRHVGEDDGGDDGAVPDELKGDGPEDEYEASNSPLVFAGEEYDGYYPGHPSDPSAAFYMTTTNLGSGAGGEIMYADDIRPTDIPGTQGLQPFHVALVQIDGVDQFGDPLSQRMTLYLDHGLLIDTDLPGSQGPYTADCAGLLAMFGDLDAFDTEDDPSPTIACHAFMANVLTPNGAYQDFTFNGLDGFTDGSGDPVVEAPQVIADKTSPPYLQWSPQRRWYAASVAPVSYDGHDFTDRIFQEASTTDPGTNWWTGAQHWGGSFIFADGQMPNALPGWGHPDGLGFPVDFHVALIWLGTDYVTLYVEEVLFPALGLTNDCAGVNDLLEDMFDGHQQEPPEGWGCEAFVQDVFLAPDDWCGDYVFNGFDDATDANGDPVAEVPTLLDGATDPPTLEYVGPQQGCPETGGTDPPGEEEPPGDDTSDPGSDDPDDPGNPDEPGSDAPDDPGSDDGSDPHGSSPTGGSDPAVPGSPGTLPRTGFELWSLVLAGLVLAAAGIVLDRRRRTVAG